MFGEKEGKRRRKGHALKEKAMCSKEKPCKSEDFT